MPELERRLTTLSYRVRVHAWRSRALHRTDVIVQSSHQHQ